MLPVRDLPSLENALEGSRFASKSLFGGSPHRQGKSHSGDKQKGMEHAEEKKASVNALNIASRLCVNPNLHPRKVAQIVVRVGPPIRITMFRVVVAIGRSFRLYSGVCSRDRRNADCAQVHTPDEQGAREYGDDRPVASQVNKGQGSCERNDAPPADTLRMPNRFVNIPMNG